MEIKSIFNRHSFLKRFVFYSSIGFLAGYVKNRPWLGLILGIFAFFLVRLLNFLLWKIFSSALEKESEVISKPNLFNDPVDDKNDNKFVFFNAFGDNSY